MKLWKRLLSIPIAACLVMGMLPTPALADDAVHSHPICGATHTDIGDHTGTCADVAWTAWNGTDPISYDANNTAYVYLEKNVERTDALSVVDGQTLYLCLNGHSITSSAAGNVIFVENSSRLILCDCKGGGKITHSDGVKGRGVEVGSTFIMYGFYPYGRWRRCANKQR